MLFERIGSNINSVVKLDVFYGLTGFNTECAPTADFHL